MLKTWHTTEKKSISASKKIKEMPVNHFRNLSELDEWIYRRIPMKIHVGLKYRAKLKKKKVRQKEKHKKGKNKQTESF